MCAMCSQYSITASCICAVLYIYTSELKLDLKARDNEKACFFVFSKRLKMTFNIVDAVSWLYSLKLEIPLDSPFLRFMRVSVSILQFLTVM